MYRLNVYEVSKFKYLKTCIIIINLYYILINIISYWILGGGGLSFPERYQKSFQFLDAEGIER